MKKPKPKPKFRILKNETRRPILWEARVRIGDT
jgi:hypothetical protein